MNSTIYDKIREYRRLKTDIYFPFEGKKIGVLDEKEKEQIKKKKDRFEELRDQLDEISVKQLAQCKKNLLLSIEKALDLTFLLPNLQTTFHLFLVNSFLSLLL